MPISNTPILAMLRTRMHWHQERQRVLAENVANADTPQFKPRDLAPPNFPGAHTARTTPVALITTNSAHLAAAATSRFETDRKGSYEVRPTGNAVSLEDEMIKVAANQMDYQAATSLYSRSLGLLKSALGKR